MDHLHPLRLEYEFTSVIGSSLFFGGSFEEAEIRFIESVLRNGDPDPVILDVGANLGLHAIRWVRTCRSARLIAFEPSPTTCELLRRNVESNRLGDRITIVPKAVSDRPGTAPFFECEDDAYSSLKDTQRKKVVTTHDVAVTTIDHFVKEARLDKLSLIKIDVEGLEKEVLLGAENSLRRFRPDLFVEIYGGERSNPDPAGTIEVVRALGYCAFVLVNGRAVSYRQHSDSYYNYFFTMNPERLPGA